ncbi:class I SAM-dependent methyltransferase [Paenibacillus kyungheensis]|uniref:Class I SAM-dependent methyltransferase n=1 Tax=Paenibacillus kyungheensis TaxID=1452732 RepID=A0AAX3M3P4_9BACL|nr:class I SAM-dependent methyltransferase [Paenibacillus kyungheensis]WCT56867.1 class I SAM-dependent methyltransferase [Paenibacillus kyungheensis]
MLHSLTAIDNYRNLGYLSTDNPYLWLHYLVSAEERIVNLERVTTLQELSNANPVLDYVERTLRILDQLRVSYWQKELIEEVLIWSETAKGGTMRERIRWQEQGINLFVHNEGSAELYMHASADPQQERTQLVTTLIRTHGLIGQCLRGEVPFAENVPLTDQVSHGVLSPEEMKTTLLILNRCIIEAVSSELWQQVQDDVLALIQPIVYQEQPLDWTTEDRILRLRAASIHKGENTVESLHQLNAQINLEQSFALLDHQTFWYVEAALQDFSFEEFAKIFTLISHIVPKDVRHISFERLMNTMYYDYKGIKKVNVYKKRMIEKVLAECSWDQLSTGTWGQDSPHLSYECVQEPHIADTVFFNFVFSPAAEKLIEFCIEAEKSPLYEKAVLLLFDLFGLRRDAYDRFHNEESYLEMMNQTVDYKRILLRYIVGETIIDIGPGGGVMLDLIEEEWSDKRAIGIDISENVIEALQRKKQLEGRSWEVMKGDALALREIVEPGSVDSVLFSSILHELYSYVPFNGHKFNLETVAAALSSAYDVLSTGGRIIIRDGIMTEPTGQKRRIQFLQDDGLSALERYAQDFVGRSIEYEVTGEQEVMMLVNDAMEFLYTYTWGEEAYVHEVQEQFGYMTPSQYRTFIEQTLGAQAHIVHLESFLQAGYTEALQPKVNITDEWGESVPLPDSTCIIVIEKT